jgi:hypothetical protein
VRKRFFPFRVLLNLVGILAIPMIVKGQIDVTTPLERSVYQREINGSAEVIISGNYSIPVDKIEVRATPVAEAQGIAIPWTTLQEKPTGGVFSGKLKMAGGWYKVEVRGLKGGIAMGNVDAISRVGVGEVFIIAGQSNAQGMDETNPSAPLPPPAKDDRVNYVIFDNESQNKWTDAPVANIQPLQLQTAWNGNGQNPNIMGPRGHTSWCWGILGDMLVQRLNVPVLFVNTGWSGTSIQNWRESSQGIITTNAYAAAVKLPAEMPYGNLRLAMQYYAKPFGARAVLWMQGETDNLPRRTSAETYKNDLKSVIAKLSSDVNRSITWVVSRTSMVSIPDDPKFTSVTSAEIISGQNAVLRDLPNNTYAGPETDKLQAFRSDGTHFFGEVALKVLANAWNETLNKNFFDSVKPIPVSQEPRITSSCADNNTSVNLSLPDGFLNYKWAVEVNGRYSEMSGKSLNVSQAGKYTGTVKDAHGNALVTQTMVINSSIKPVTPTIRENGSQQACADSSFTFSIQPGNYLYNWYKQGTSASLETSSSLSVSASGNYFVRSESVFGCVSNNSDVSSLTIRSRTPTPIIERTGPFSALATISQSDLKEQYDWKVGNDMLTTSKINVIRTAQTGVYAARAGVTYVMGNNLLTCYSPFSNDLQVITEGVSDVVVFPNPGTRDNVYVEALDDITEAEIIVYDLYGRILTSQIQDMKSRVKVPLNNLQPGKYVVRIKGATIDTTRQLVVN